MLLIKNGELIGARYAKNKSDSCGKVADILVKDDIIADIAESIVETGDMETIDATGLFVAPGLVDLHVHFREPGFEYKEDILSGAAAAAAGGVTTCCCMPNTFPVADNEEVITYIYNKVRLAPINVLPVGAVTVGQQGKELTDFASLIKAGAVALSDDGIPIHCAGVMKSALKLASQNDILIISHCEEETPMAARDISLADETGTRVHIAHVSKAETVEVIRKAKKAGIKVTAETCPHYFSLTESIVKEKGTLAQMNPPLATQEDVDAIIEGLCDGTIDVIATDHAPHSKEEKALPPDKAPNGIIGLETSLATALTFLYHTSKLSLEQIITLMSKNPAEILKLEAGVLEKGRKADIIVFDPSKEWTVNPSQLKSKARNTPYGGMKLHGKINYTISCGKVVYLGK
jgi:dihydroorotase